MKCTKDGYKYIEGIGCIPKEWKVKKVKDICELNPGRVSVEDENLDVTFLSMSDISEDGKIINTKIKSYKEVKKGFTPFLNNDILVAKITPCFENGKGAYISNLKNGIGFGSTEFHVLRSKQDIYGEFLFYHTKDYKFRKKGEINMTGSAGQKRVPINFISQYKIPIPTFKEQIEIVKILSVWDKAIERVEGKIEEKKVQNRVLIKELLSGKKRIGLFKESSWRKIELKKFMKQVTRSVNKPCSSYYAIGIRSYGKGTFDKFVDDPSKVQMDILYEVKENDLIVNITFAWEGAIAIAKKSDEGKLVSHRFPTYELNKNIIIPEYMRYVIVQPQFVYLLGAISPGGAGRNRVMSKKDFLKLKVNLPSIKEQEYIANILNISDREIKLLQQKLEKLKNQKKGLMQQLLTGKIRVKI